MYIPVRPLPIRERASILFLEHGRIDVVDQAFVLIQEGIRTPVPIGGLACVMLEPGIRITHAAVALAASVGCLLVWVGEGGVRLYAAGQPGGARASRLLYQAKLAIDEISRLSVVRAMYRRRFGEDAPSRRSIEQLRGIEGARVREAYRAIAVEHGVQWAGRRYNPRNFRDADVPNQCLSAANACLYGLTEAAILAAGYAPAIGFLHRGYPQSFVYDIADLVKFETAVPAAFKTAAAIAKGEGEGPPERRVRHACRDAFRTTRLLDRLIPLVHDVLAESGEQPPEDAPEGMERAFMELEDVGDDGHRY